MLAALPAYGRLFDHRTASAAFVVGTTRVVPWDVKGPRRRYHHALMALAWVVVPLWSEVLPSDLLEACRRPWHYTMVPILLAWPVMLRELLRPRDAAARAQDRRAPRVVNARPEGRGPAPC